MPGLGLLPQNLRWVNVTQEEVAAGPYVAPKLSCLGQLSCDPRGQMNPTFWSSSEASS
jgi:hypothetical protein